MKPTEIILTYDVSVEQRILFKLDELPPEGYSRWDGRLLAEALRDVSKQRVWQVLRQHGISLKRRRSWCYAKVPLKKGEGLAPLLDEEGPGVVEPLFSRGHALRCRNPAQEPPVRRFDGFQMISGFCFMQCPGQSRASISTMLFLTLSIKFASVFSGSVGTTTMPLDASNVSGSMGSRFEI